MSKTVTSYQWLVLIMYDWQIGWLTIDN